MQLTSYFSGLLGNIEPKPEFVKKAQKAHEDLRDLLKKDEQISKANPDSFLSGSYARDTAINDIKDVDVILLIDLDCNKTTPDIAVGWLQASLQNYYSKVIPQGRSVQVTADNGVKLDVVLAVPISHRDGPVKIPDRDVKEWVVSHPKGQISFATQRHKDTGEFYKHLVKIMKYWRDRIADSNARVKSYILESLVAECISTEPQSYADAVVYILNCIYQRYSSYLSVALVPKIYDPGYSSVNVAKRWKFSEFSAFLAKIKTSFKIARAALDSDNEEQSIRLWRELFGSKFLQNE